MARNPDQRSRKPLHYHLIGIGGTAMASLAGLLKAAGHTVTGSDENVYPPMSTELRSMRISYREGYRAENLPSGLDVVVVGNVVSRGNPELEEVLVRKLRYTSAAATIKEEFIWGHHSLAVAGTHGKTTTTSLLAWVLESAGLKPSFLIGGVAENFGASFRLTDSKYFVIEADEYDTALFDKGPKMWHYLPRTAVVNNVEFDHADIYRDETAYRWAFERFVNLVPKSGTLVLGWETPIARGLAAKSLAPVESVGIEEREGGDKGHPRWRAARIEYGRDGTSFDVLHGTHQMGRVDTPLSGAFNVRNVLAALAAARSVGADWDKLLDGLRTFRSVRRRMEIRGEVRGITVVDDFAHHPTAVRETIEATRQRFAGRRVIAIFEPRSYTAQRKESQEPYREALGRADRVLLAGLFRPERYDANTGLDPSELAASLTADGVPTDYIPDVDRIVATVTPEARPGDVLLVMSNGGFGGIHGKLLEALGQ